MICVEILVIEIWKSKNVKISNLIEGEKIYLFDDDIRFILDYGLLSFNIWRILLKKIKKKIGFYMNYNINIVIGLGRMKKILWWYYLYKWCFGFR